MIFLNYLLTYLGVMTGDAAQAAEISLGEANDDATTEISLRDFFCWSYE